MAPWRALGPADAFDPLALEVVVPALEIPDVEGNVGEADLVPRHRGWWQLRLEGKDLQHGAARDPNPADLAAAPLPVHAEERAHALGIGVGDANERAPEHLPVEPDGAVEVRHRDAAVAEGSRSHRAVCMMGSAVRSACATIVNPGLTAADEGKNDASTTNRFRRSCARQNGSSTEVRGSFPKTSVPHWCVVLRLPCECFTTIQNPR